MPFKHSKWLWPRENFRKTISFRTPKWNILEQQETLPWNSHLHPFSDPSTFCGSKRSPCPFCNWVSVYQQGALASGVDHQPPAVCNLNLAVSNLRAFSITSESKISSPFILVPLSLFFLSHKVSLGFHSILYFPSYIYTQN